MSAAAAAAWLSIAVLFAIVTGANDGGAVLTMGLRVPMLRPAGAILVLVLGVSIAPVLFGTRVAATMTRRMVAFQAAGGRVAFLIGLCAALVVVASLTWRGLPTSLTLAVIGGIAGGGWGYGIRVAWAGVFAVLGVGMLAPLVGALAGLYLSRAFRWAPTTSTIPAIIRTAMLCGYALQSLAYGANDGQKMIAVFAIAGVMGGGGASALPAAAVTTVGVSFALGVALSLRRLAGRLGRDLLAVRPIHAVSAELASSAAVFVSAAAGMPVSMTQTIAGALVGAGASDSSRRVRWQAVAKLGAAWAITLPTSVLLAASVAVAARWAR